MARLEKRPAALATRALKDRRQAEQLFRVLLEDRPADIMLAYDAAKKQGNAFIANFENGLEPLDREVADAVKEKVLTKSPEQGVNHVTGMGP